MRISRPAIALVAGLLVAVSLLGTVATPAGAATTTLSWQVALRSSFTAVPAGVLWRDGQTYGAWRSDFNGYGATKVRVLDQRVLSQRPKAATRPSQTHASLVTTRRRFGTIDVSAQLRTVRQLRTGSRPNPWEVAWVLWNYRDNVHFYYLVLKPNGWELGKEDPAYPGAQRFLATGSGSFPVGRWHGVRIRQVGNVITVWADGVRLTRFRDTERPYLTGRVGLYNEDAEVHFRRIVVRTAS